MYHALCINIFLQVIGGLCLEICTQLLNYRNPRNPSLNFFLEFLSHPQSSIGGRQHLVTV